MHPETVDHTSIILCFSYSIRAKTQSSTLPQMKKRSKIRIPPPLFYVICWPSFSSIPAEHPNTQSHRGRQRTHELYIRPSMIPNTSVLKRALKMATFFFFLECFRPLLSPVHLRCCIARNDACCPSRKRHRHPTAFDEQLLAMTFALRTGR